jgi:hypothetical protein
MELIRSKSLYSNKKPSRQSSTTNNVLKSSFNYNNKYLNNYNNRSQQNDSGKNNGSSANLLKSLQDENKFIKQRLSEFENKLLSSKSSNNTYS